MAKAQQEEDKYSPLALYKAARDVSSLVVRPTPEAPLLTPEMAIFYRAKVEWVFNRSVCDGALLELLTGVMSNLASYSQKGAADELEDALQLSVTEYCRTLGQNLRHAQNQPIVREKKENAEGGKGDEAGVWDTAGFPNVLDLELNANGEFVCRQLLTLGVRLDLGDEIGRRRLINLLSEYGSLRLLLFHFLTSVLAGILTSVHTPESLIELAMGVLLVAHGSEAEHVR